MIQVGDALPNVALAESTKFPDKPKQPWNNADKRCDRCGREPKKPVQEIAACAQPPETVMTAEAAKGKTIVIVGLIGAFTDDCALDHVPGYISHAIDLRGEGVDEIWFVAVNDGFAMGYFGRTLLGKDSAGAAELGLRFLGDGNAAFAKALGLDIDLSAINMGTRMNRSSLLVVDGVVKRVNREAPMKLEVSDAATMLKQLAE